ncbi:ribosome-like protein [Panicum miliaceum]|uniref:Ribosome-like protein n=1 Tax=Panicum miliaceum TaxID=4540 RepID=A0A3L6PPK0_PANMI|nr:ribosome-like protein [Panicum miliaceum]
MAAAAAVSSTRPYPLLHPTTNATFVSLLRRPLPAATSLAHSAPSQPCVRGLALVPAANRKYHNAKADAGDEDVDGCPARASWRRSGGAGGTRTRGTSASARHGPLPGGFAGGASKVHIRSMINRGRRSRTPTTMRRTTTGSSLVESCRLTDKEIIEKPGMVLPAEEFQHFSSALFG